MATRLPSPTPPPHRPGRGSGVILSDDAAPPPRGYFDPVNRLRSMYAQVRAMDPLRADAALAALFVVAAVFEVIFIVPSNGDSYPVTIAGAVVAQGALVLRRRDPLLAAAVFSGVTVLQAALGGFLTQDATLTYLTAMLLLFSIGRYSVGRPFWAALPVMMGGSAIALSIEAGLERAEYLVWFFLIFSLPALVGRGLRSRAQLQHE